jgi:mono/diheme cytochrome c family protein
LTLAPRQFVVLVLLILVIATSFVLLRSDVTRGSGPIASTNLNAEELIARGEYLVIAGNCASCHTTAGGEFMAGGLAFATPFGNLYSTNITPDPDTGIGEWDDWDFLNSMRHGVRPDGEHLYPAFPYTAFTKITNEDIAAMFAYLKQLPPVESTPPTNELSFPFNKRFLMGFWKALYFDQGEFELVEEESVEWNRGAYLVEGLAHCSACHTPRNSLGAELSSQSMSGGEYADRVGSGNYRPWAAPNITASQHGLGLWTQQALADYLKTARNDFLESFGPMNEVIMNSTRFLTEDDITAMTTYLKSLPAIDEPSGITPDPQLMGRGRTIYNLHCGTCHLPTGEGDPEMAPKLNVGSLVVQDSNPASMINAILYSPETPGQPLLPRWRDPMEEFEYLLDDEEIAAVATYIRHSWDNNAGIVTPDQVALQR